MAETRTNAAGSGFPLGRRNLLVLALAVLALAAGYAVLAAGHPSTAAVLLVLGYCILFPIGIAI